MKLWKQPKPATVSEQRLQNKVDRQRAVAVQVDKAIQTQLKRLRKEFEIEIPSQT